MSGSKITHSNIILGQIKNSNNIFTTYRPIFITYNVITEVKKTFDKYLSVCHNFWIINLKSLFVSVYSYKLFLIILGQ